MQRQIAIVEDEAALRALHHAPMSRATDKVLPALDKHKLGELIDLISGIGLGTAAHREKDTLGRVYEYFLSRFASAEGRGGGEFYTPTSIVRLIVEIIEPLQHAFHL